MTRREKILNGAAKWAAYYRANPARFARDYLHLDLKWFQKLLLTMMVVCNIFVFIGSRGIGKTFLSAIYCVVRAILWPGSKIVVASGTRGQAYNILEKIMLELKPRSPELALEIDEKQTKMNGTNAIIVFKNSSFIKVVTSGDSARGNRADVIILDEARLIAKDTIDTIFRKFLTNIRMPPYRALSTEECAEAYRKERKLTMYLTSAYWSDSWMYQKCMDTLRFMVNDNRKQFVCGLPYQLSIEEGLLDPEIIADEMSESDFSEVKFDMEYGALFFGAGEDSFFQFDTISKNRHIKYPMLPGAISQRLPQSGSLRIPPKQPAEIRILSADIALMSSKKHDNDATSIFLNQMVMTKSGRYTENIVYADGGEGMMTQDQALMIRKLFDEYECDYLAIDANGVGAGVVDLLFRDIMDPETGEVYPALGCCNDKSMSDREVPGAQKVIWAIKASAQFNSDCAFQLREGFRSGKIRLLISDYDADEALGSLKGYGALDDRTKMRLKEPYYHTTLLINELVKLDHEEANGRVRMYERAGMRKDRYSSLAYNHYVALQVERQKQRRSIRSSEKDDEEVFMYRAPKIK